MPDPHTGAASADDDEATIRAIVAEQTAAWNAGDGVAYSRHVAPEVTFTNVFGSLRYGAAEFADRHTEILSTFFRGTTKRHEIRRIRFVTPDVAVVDVENEVHDVPALPPGGTEPAGGVLATRLLEVLVRRDGRWWVEAYHNVRVGPGS